MEQISGHLERITYHSEKNGFTVAKIQEKNQPDLTTVVGHLTNVNPGESLRLWGRWVSHHQYGRQFRIEKYETVAPATVNGIEKYLGSGLIKGIGPVMASRIVKVFGRQTLEIIASEPDKLTQVEGIGDKRIAMIKEAWEEQKEVRHIMIFLQEHGISTSYAAKIFQRYGNQAIELVQENPYQLAADIHGIGFVTADNMARSLGFNSQSPLRVAEGVIYVLSQLTGEGHSYYPASLLIEKAVAMLQVEEMLAARAITKLHDRQRLALEKIGGETAVYLIPLYVAEKGVAQNLNRLFALPPDQHHINLTKALAQAEQNIAAKLAPQQQKAVTKATQNKIMVITGGPGTGKTTITKAIINIFAALDQKIFLAAPTGRAAKRMQEATDMEARTIHRMLEYSPGGGFQRNQENPLLADIIIVDEASMIDIVLMHHLLNAVPQEATLILVGDVQQLPSVGPGNVLKDIIAAGKFPVVTLTEIFRQAKHSKIVTSAHSINQGYLPSLKSPPKEQITDFYFIPKEDPQQALEIILHLCHQHIPRRFGLDAVRDIQVLTPMHRGVLGVANLNHRLQQKLNHSQDKITRGYKTFKTRDKVMQIKNNYQKDIYNGDVGTVINIDREEQQMMVNFDGRPVIYEFSQLDELITAYAVSIHKSQGSEYPAVVIPVTMQHYLLLQRNLIYTGITRGKKLVVLVGSKKALAIAVKNNQTMHRYTGLRERLLANQQPIPHTRET